MKSRGRKRPNRTTTTTNSIAPTMSVSEVSTVLVVSVALVSLVALVPTTAGGRVSSSSSSIVESQAGGLERLLRTDGEYLWQSYVPFYMQPFFGNLSLSNEVLKALETTVRGSCMGELVRWRLELGKLRKTPTEVDTWALHMIDSWGKPAEGILTGHVNSMGDYDECVGLRSGGQSVSGLYCTTYISPAEARNSPAVPDTEEMRLKHAVSIVELEAIMTLASDISIQPSIASCFPSTCSKEEVQALFNEYFLRANFTQLYNLKAHVGNCETDEKPRTDAAVVVMIGVLIGFALLCLTATMLEYYQAKRAESEKPPHPDDVRVPVKVLLAFSVIRNTKLLLTTSGENQERFTCFFGLRFLSMAWIILSHTWGMLVASPTTWNLVDVKLIFKEDWTSLFVLNGLVAVDTFFTIGGLLVCYNLLNTLEKSKGSLNLLKHYFYRYLRLTPTYGLLIGFVATILPYLSSGPNWYVMDMWSVNCRRNWWHNLLFVNNLIDYGTDFQANGMCAGLSWYLSADMQFFVLSPFLIYPLWRWRVLGKVILGVVTLGSILSPAIISYIYHVPPTLISFRGNSTLATHMLYFKPWTRAGPYIVGIWMGYLLFITRNGSSVKIPKRLIVAGWCISTATALSILLGIKSYFDPTYEIPLVGGAFYAGLHRFVWGLVIAWIIFACVKGHAEWVNRFLSWKVFAPLSRITFSMYLSSYFVQMGLHLRLRQPLYYDTYTMVNLFLAHLLMSILISAIMTICIEFPFLHLDKLFLRSTVRRQRSEDSNSTDSSTRPLNSSSA